MVAGRGELSNVSEWSISTPDLCLTRWQATRLWNLGETICDDLPAVLVGEGFLVKTREGLFLRRHDDSVRQSLSA